jgi:hypothetical protein
VLPVVLPVKIGCRRAALPARGAAGPVTREALPARGAAGQDRLPRVSTVPVLLSCADLRDSVLESVATVARRAELAARSVVTDVPILRALPNLPARASAF